MEQHPHSVSELSESRRVKGFPRLLSFSTPRIEISVGDLFSNRIGHSDRPQVRDGRGWRSVEHSGDTRRCGVVMDPVLEFLARVTDHIPEAGQQLIRNWAIIPTPPAQSASERRGLKAPIRTA